MNEQRSQRDGFPDIGRADSQLVVLSQWNVTPARQQVVAETLVTHTTRLDWPPGLLSVSYFTSTDGERIARYTQWTNEQLHKAFLDGYRATLATRNVELPEQAENVNYRLYRSGVRDGAPVPGCVVLVSVTFADAGEARVVAWIDTVFEAMAAEAVPYPGGISGHFHVSVDGTRALNYAEWVDEDAHRDAIEKGRGSIGTNPLWRRVHAFPGIVSSGVNRYQLFWSRDRASFADSAHVQLLASDRSATGV